MPLTLLGLSWNETATSPPGIVRFKVPSLVGWKPDAAVVDVRLDNTPAGDTGQLQFSLQASNTKKTATLTMQFRCAVTRDGATWALVPGAHAAGPQILRARPSGASKLELELRFNLLDALTTAAHVFYHVDEYGELYASPSTDVDLLDPKKLGVLRFLLLRNGRIYPSLFATPRAKITAASLALVPLLRDTSPKGGTLEFPAHPALNDLSLSFGAPAASTVVDLSFACPQANTGDPDFLLPFGAYKGQQQAWLAPVAIRNYQLNTRWNCLKRVLTSFEASPASKGSFGLVFPECISNAEEPLQLECTDSLPLSVQLRMLPSGFLAKPGIDTLLCSVNLRTLPSKRQFYLPLDGLSFEVDAAGATPFADLVSIVDTVVPPAHGLRSIGSALVTGESFQTLLAHPAAVGRFLVDPGKPFHSPGQNIQYERLQAFWLSDPTALEATALPIVSPDAEHIARPSFRSEVISELDQTVKALVVADVYGTPLQSMRWVRPDNMVNRRQLAARENANIGVSSLYAGLLAGTVPDLTLVPHELWQARTILETLTLQSKGLGALAQSVNPAYVVRELASLRFYPTPALSIELEQTGTISLSPDTQQWFLANRPPPTELPYAIVKPEQQPGRMGDWLSSQINGNPKYQDIYAALNDLGTFPTWWTGLILLEVTGQLNPDTPVGVAMGSTVVFRLIALSHTFDREGPFDPMKLRTTQAIANPPDSTSTAPPPPSDPLVAALYSVTSRRIRIDNHVISSLALRAKVYAFSFLGLSLSNSQTGEPLQLDMAGQYDALRGDLVISSTVPLGGVEVDLGSAISFKYWPFDALRLLRITARIDKSSNNVSTLKLLLDGEIDVRESFADLIRHKANEPLQFTGVELASLGTPLPQLLKIATRGKARSGQFEVPLRFVYMAAKWAIDSARFSLGTRWGALTFNGLDYNLSNSVAQDYSGLIPLDSSSPNWSSLGYVVLRFTLELDVTGGALRALPGVTLQLLVTWPLDKSSRPHLDQPALGLRFTGLNSFVIPIFPGVLLQARRFSMVGIDVPGTSERVPWFSLLDASLETVFGDLFTGSSISAGMFLRNDGRSGFAVLWQERSPNNMWLQPHWLLAAQNLTLPPGYAWAKDMLAPKNLGDVGEQKKLADLLYRVLDAGNHQDALQPIPATDRFISSWLVAGGFSSRGDLVEAKFFHQDGAFSGLNVGGALVKAFTGGKGVTLMYSRGRTPEEDSFEVIVALPSISVVGFEARGGEFRLRVSASGDFLLDAAYPFPDEKGFRNWGRTTSLSIAGFQAMGGFYVARYRGPDLPVASASSSDTRLAFGTAAAWGRSFRTDDSGWFKGEIFFGFIGLFEGTILSRNGTLYIERLVGAGGVLVTARATVCIWIITASVTLQAYAELRVEYVAAANLVGKERPRLARYSPPAVGVAPTKQLVAGTRAALILSATLAVRVSFEVEIDLFLYSYRTTIGATYSLSVEETIYL